MSIRSRIGPEIFSAYRRITCGVHWQVPPGRRRLSARTGVRGHDQLEGRGIAGHALAAVEQHRTGLQRRTQRVDHRRRELRRLVQEQHSLVGNGDRPRPGQPRTAADHADHRRGVVRVAVGRAGDQAGRRGGSRPASAPPRPPARPAGRGPAAGWAPARRASSCPPRADRGRACDGGRPPRPRRPTWPPPGRPRRRGRAAWWRAGRPARRPPRRARPRALGSPRIRATSWLIDATPNTSMPATSLASPACRSGTMTRVKPA